MAKSKRPLIWVIVVIAVCVIVAGGLTAYFLLRKKPQEDNGEYTEIEQAFANKFAVDETLREDDEDIISGALSQEYLSEIGLFEIVDIKNKFGEYLVADVKESATSEEKLAVIKYNNGESGELELSLINIDFTNGLEDFTIHNIADGMIVYSSTESSGLEHDLTLYSIAIIDAAASTASVKVTGIDYYYKEIVNNYVIFARVSGSFWIFKMFYFNGTDLVNVAIHDQYCYSFKLTEDMLLVNCKEYNRIYQLHDGVAVTLKTFANTLTEVSGEYYHMSFGGKYYNVDELYNVKHIVGKYFLVEQQKTFSHQSVGTVTKKYHGLDVYCKLSYAIFNAERGELQNSLSTDNYEIYTVNDSGIDGVGMLVQQTPYEGQYESSHNNKILYFDEAFNKVMEYDAAYGMITTYRDKKFVTAVNMGSRNISYVIDIDGNLLQSSADTYTFTGLNEIDGCIEVEDNESFHYGVIDADGNVIIPLEYSKIFPINSHIQTVATQLDARLVDGLTEMYYVQYRFDHADKVVIENYTDEFDDWLAYGLGVYFTKVDDVYSLYDYSGTLIDTDITSVVFYKNDNKVFLTYCYKQAGGHKMVKFTSFNSLVKNWPHQLSRYIDMEIYLGGEATSYGIEKTSLVLPDSDRNYELKDLQKGADGYYSCDLTVDYLDKSGTVWYYYNFVDGDVKVKVIFTLTVMGGVLTHNAGASLDFNDTQYGYKIKCYTKDWQPKDGNGNNIQAGDNTITDGYSVKFKVTWSNAIMVCVDSTSNMLEVRNYSQVYQNGELDLTLGSSDLHTNDIDKCFFGGYTYFDFIKEDDKWNRNADITDYFAPDTTLYKNSTLTIVVQSLWVKKAFSYNAFRIKNTTPYWYSIAAKISGSYKGEFEEYIVPATWNQAGKAVVGDASVSSTITSGDDDFTYAGTIIDPREDDWTQPNGAYQKYGSLLGGKNNPYLITPLPYDSVKNLPYDNDTSATYNFFAFYTNTKGDEVTIGYSFNGTNLTGADTCKISGQYYSLNESEMVDYSSTYNAADAETKWEISDQKFGESWELSIEINDESNCVISDLTFTITSTSNWESYCEIYVDDGYSAPKIVKTKGAITIPGGVRKMDLRIVNINADAIKVAISVLKEQCRATLNTTLDLLLSDSMYTSFSLPINNSPGNSVWFTKNEDTGATVYNKLNLARYINSGDPYYVVSGFYYVENSKIGNASFTRHALDLNATTILNESIQIFPILESRQYNINFKNSSTYSTEKTFTAYAGETLVYNHQSMSFYIADAFDVVEYKVSLIPYTFISNTTSLGKMELISVFDLDYNATRAVTGFTYNGNSLNSTSYSVFNQFDFYINRENITANSRDVNFYYCDFDTNTYERYAPAGYSLDIDSNGYTPTPLESTFASYPSDVYMAGWLILPKGALETQARQDESVHETVRRLYYDGTGTFAKYLYHQTRCNLKKMDVYAVYLENTFIYKEGNILRLSKPPIYLVDGTAVEFDYSADAFTSSYLTMQYKFVKKSEFDAAFLADESIFHAYAAVTKYDIDQSGECYKLAVIVYNNSQVLDVAIELDDGGDWKVYY